MPRGSGNRPALLFSRNDRDPGQIKDSHRSSWNPNIRENILTQLTMLNLKHIPPNSFDKAFYNPVKSKSFQLPDLFLVLVKIDL